MSDLEKQIVSEKPDYDNQMEILHEEKMQNKKKKAWFILCCLLFILVILIFVFAYSNIYFYKEFNSSETFDACENVNINFAGSLTPNINIAVGDCKPIYNVDYFNNRKALFNVDIYGDKSYIFNQINQKNESGVCLLNCDFNEDGWPDYNIDLDGNGTADLNIIFDQNPNDYTCDLNCDLNYDMIADTNIDTNNDNIADINVNTNDYKHPLYNIDYKANRIATFNVTNDGGKTVENKVTDAMENSCNLNCDIDGDGFPDYNLNINGQIINEVISKSNSKTASFTNYKSYDWKCLTDLNALNCSNKKSIYEYSLINIDFDGDGLVDINKSIDGGITLENIINKKINDIILNEDVNNDGYPDINIDINNDGIADINITDNDSNKCIKNCDTNYDGKKDYLVEYPNNTFSLYNLNLDTNYDGKCDVNCDLNSDLFPDVNIDNDGDKMPDLNIDYDFDNVADYNIDIDNDGYANNNIDVYGLGTCNFNCENGQINKVEKKDSCIRNCDTNEDGYPDKYVDIDNDNKCDFNCQNNTNIDSNNNYVLDADEVNEDYVALDKDSLYVIRPINIDAVNIEPSWKKVYALDIINKTDYAVNYNLIWDNVTNTFSTDHLKYYMTSNGTRYLEKTALIFNNSTLENNVILSAHTTRRYVMEIEFLEMGYNQIEDSGKIFKGKLTINAN